jgi:enoyl-[acyl-carrier protein] reductase I
VNNKNYVVLGVANKWSIAWGIAEKLIDNDAHVIFTYFMERNKKSIEKLLKDKGVEKYDLIELDVSDDENFEKAFDTIGDRYDTIDGLVHSVAYANKDELKGNYYDTSREGYLLAQNISAYSLVKAAKYASQLMNEGGSIITMTYLGGERVVKNYNVMGVAKAALEANVKYLAHDLGEQGIRINAISAGPIKTLSAKGVGEFNKLLNIYKDKAPLRQLVTIEDIGNTGLYLLSDLSSAVTGETIHVDGGYNILGY